MYVSLACSKFARIFLGNRDNPGTSHTIFKRPWPGDPRVNIQNDKGKAKAYQVRQALLAIDKLKEHQNER